MGCMINISSELTTSQALDDTQKQIILAIKNGYGDTCFGIHNDDDIMFLISDGEGMNPVADYVEIPLNALISYLKEQDVMLNGYIEIYSSWSDYSNIHIQIKDNEIKYRNTEVMKCSDDELISELIARGHTLSTIADFMKTEESED